MQKKYLSGLMTISISGIFISHLAFAAPQGGEVVAGSAVISQSGNITTVKQDSWSAVINWKNFDTAANESVVFDQPHAIATVLNRINSGLPTNFAGNLLANGKVFIVNPAGMVFAKGSSINAASFIATTADIKDADFMNKNYKFWSSPGSEKSVIINNGKITADTSGLVALIAPNVSNGKDGIVEAYMGTVELAAGKDFVLDFNQDHLINFDIANVVNTGSVENAGKISADGGRVIMSTEAVSQVLDNVINMSGTIEANRVRVLYDGKVELLTDRTGSVNISGKINANKINVNAGQGITLSGQLKTTTGFDFADISLTSGGAITETETGGIKTYGLETTANRGITLDSKNNDINHFSATNWASGNVILKNNGSSGISLRLSRIIQNAGDLIIVSNGRIVQDSEIYHTAFPMYVSGSSTFITTGHNSPIYLSAKESLGANQFKGPVSIVSESDIEVGNSKFDSTLTLKTPEDASISSVGNITLGDINILGEFDVTSNHGDILQAPNTSLSLSGKSNFTAQEGSILLTNLNNNISGAIILRNDGVNLPITLYNSIDTELETVIASGIITVVTPGELNLNHLWISAICSTAQNPPNGHSIILSGSSLYYGGPYVNPGSHNSVLIYLPNPAANSPDSRVIHSAGSGILGSAIWGTSYTTDSPASIPAGNYFVYADHEPK